MLMHHVSLKDRMMSVFLMVTMVFGAVDRALFSFVPLAMAATTVVVNTSGLPNGFFPGAPVKVSSNATGILKLSATPSSAGQTLTSVTVTFSGTSFATTTLANIDVATSSGVALYRDVGAMGGSFDSSDQVVTLAASPNWTGSSAAITLSPATAVSLTSGTATVLFVAIRTSGSAANGTQIVATVGANGVVTSDGNGPSASFTSTDYRVDSVPPTISQIESFSGSANVTVRFSEGVQSAAGGPVTSTTSLVYADGGGSAQTISSINHMPGQDRMTLTMSGNLDALDVSGGGASRLAMATNTIMDMAGNVGSGAIPSIAFGSPLSITTVSVPGATTGTFYGSTSTLVTFAAAGGSGSGYAFTLAAGSSTEIMTLLGLSLASDGKVTGTVANVLGSFSIAVKVVDSATASTTRPFTINVGGAGGGGIPGIVSVNPSGGPQNSTGTVGIIGMNTHFSSASSVLEFLMPVGLSGTNGMTVNSLTIASATSASAAVTIASGATAERVMSTSQRLLVTTYRMDMVFASGGAGRFTATSCADATNVNIPPAFNLALQQIRAL